MTNMVRCLILEQDELTIKKYVNCMHSTYEIFFVSEASELLKKIVSYSPTIILLNIQYIPKILSMVSTIKKISPQINIIITTKNPIVREAVSCMRSGVFDYIGIPFTEEDLSFSLSQTVAQKQGNSLATDTEQKNKLVFIGELAAEVAHDIKTPLSCMVGFINLYLKLMKKENVSLEELQGSRHYLEQCISEAERCKKILNNLLLFSRKENFTHFKLRKIVGEIKSLLIKDLELLNIDIELNIGEDLAAYGSSDKLYQVLLNLIVNAKNAMKEGVITVSAFTEKSKLKIIVQDNGKGIEEEDLHKIFIPFYTKTKNGNGLGLSIAKKIIEEHSGKIFVTSVVNEGSTFTIELPLQ